MIIRLDTKRVMNFILLVVGCIALVRLSKTEFQVQSSGIYLLVQRTALLRSSYVMSMGVYSTTKYLFFLGPS